MPTKIMLFGRIILGLIFLIFGLNGFFQFIPIKMNPEAMEFFAALTATPFFIFLKSTEVIVGLMLIFNFFVPLALIILAPISINILLFHLFVDRSILPLAIAIVIIHMLEAYGRREAYRSLFRR